MTHHWPHSDRLSVNINLSSDVANHEGHNSLSCDHRDDGSGGSEDLGSISTGPPEPEPSSPPPPAPRPSERKLSEEEPQSSSSVPLPDEDIVNQAISRTNELDSSPFSSVYEGIRINYGMSRLNEPESAFDLSNHQTSRRRGSQAESSSDLATSGQYEREFAIHAPQASSGVLFDKDTPRKIEYQKTMKDTAGLEWWPPKDHVESSALCAECRAISFKEVFHPPLVKNKEGPWIQIYERDTGAYQQTVKDSSGIEWLVNDPNCLLCRYLVAVRRRRSGKPEAGKYFITFHEGWGVDKSRSFRHKHGFSNSLFEVYIKVCYPPLNGSRWGPDSHDALHTIICHINKPIRRTHHPQIVFPVYNIPLAKFWLEYFRRNHAECTIENSVHIPKTRLIDCTTRRLVLAGDDAMQKPRFVALSYVWGQEATVGQTSLAGELPSNLPLTIHDAITVTKELGFQFLWVDQYCIDQSDDGDKRRQIQQMDLIYKCASLTIIAAAGNDCNYGLPGVSSRSRDVPDPFVLDEVLTFGILPNARDHWKSGSWHTRGWTFQEAHLSGRRLVFSDTAMQFECMCGGWQAEMWGGVECADVDAATTNDSSESCSERSDSNSEEVYVVEACVEPVVGESTLSRPVEIRENFNQPVRDKRAEASILSYTDLVTQYTSRTLSYPSDGLNAFSGMANALAQFDPPVYNIAGIPFVVHGHSEGILTEATFSYGLAWRSVTGGVVPDPNFPSWSWGNVAVWSVAWRSEKEENTGYQRHATGALEYPRGVRIEFNSNGSKELIGLAEFAEACQDLTPLSRRYPIALCFKARIFSSHVVLEVQPESKVGDIRELLGDGKHDLGRGYEGLVYIVVDVDVAPNDEQSDRSGGAGQVDFSQLRCFLETDDKGLFEDIDSGRCSLMLLCCNGSEAQMLVVEWQDGPNELQRTARRVGILRFEMKPPGGDNSVDEFLSCFSIETDVRLI